MCAGYRCTFASNKFLQVRLDAAPGLRATPPFSDGPERKSGEAVAVVNFGDSPFRLGDGRTVDSMKSLVQRLTGN